MLTGQIPSAACFVRKMGERRGSTVLFHDENTGAIDLAFEPGNTGTIYAALLQTRRPPWNVYPPSKGPGSGLYRSRDGGEHWEALTGHGLPSEEVGRMGIAFAPSNPQRIYLIADAKAGGLYRSDDGGANWQLMSRDKRIWQRGWYFEEVTVDPKDPDIVYVPNTTLYRSRDGGKTFVAFKGAPGGDDYHQLWIDPEEPRRMIMGVDQEPSSREMAARRGAPGTTNRPAQFYHVITDDRFPYWVYGAQQDSGSAATPSRGKYRRAEFSRLAADRGRRRKWLHRARSRKSRRGLRRIRGPAGYGQRADAAAAAHTSASGRLPAHLDFAAGVSPSRRMFCIFRRKFCFARAMAAARGR